MAETEDRSTVPERSDETAGGGRRRVTLIVLSVVVALVVIGVVIALAVRPGAPAADSTAKPSGSPSASASASALPTAEPGSTLPPAGTADDTIGFDDVAPIVDGVTVRIDSIEAVDGEASQPGEIAGPSVRVTVVFTNSSKDAYSLAGAVTNAYYGSDLTPATELAAPGGSPFPEEVAAGETARGVFIFNIPEAERDNVRITVDYAAAESAVVFQGAAPRS